MKVITISREYGAGGHTIGVEVAKALGIELYDKDIIRKTAEAMETHADGGKDYYGRCWIAHSNCMDAAEELRDMVAKAFRNLKRNDIKIFDIGTIITSHTGPGTLALFFFGDERTR